MSIRKNVIVFIIIWGLIFSLFKILYIMNDERYVNVGKSQSSYSLVIDKARGTIYDCNLLPLTNNSEVYKGSIINTPDTLRWIDSNFSTSDKSSIFLRLNKGRPIVIESENKGVTQGSYFIKCGRYYDDSKSIIADHILGYLDSDGNGVIGIEKAYNEYLVNKTSVKTNYYLDARNNVLNGVELTVEGVNTHDYKKGIVLTIDNRIQQICEEVAENKISLGAVIVQDISNGQIKASVSLPQYSVFDVSSALTAKDSPLINRTFSAYNVGSVFKLCIAAAALENGYFEEYQYECTGKIKIGSTVFNCNNHGGHGKISMSEAIKYSCNTYFINLALNVGCSEIYKMSTAFGFGEKKQLCNSIVTAKGSLPELYELQKNIGELANLSFGQGKLLATPVHINSMVLAIANGGILIEPRLVQGLVDSNREYVQLSEYKSKRIMKQTTAKKLKQMMVETVENGTGKNAWISYGAGGKTASAETGRAINGKSITQCWFSGFFPKTNPKYAITVLVENGVSGSSSAAPVFAEIAQRICIMESES